MTIDPRQAPPKAALRFERKLSKPSVHPYDTVQWVRRDARIQEPSGKIVFEQLGVEFPESWSQTAVNVVTSKYFRGALGTSERETSLRQVIDRVAGTVARWGREDGYFENDDAETFEQELRTLLLDQSACFNSPVWFNVGIFERPQCSACFINSVEDSMSSIMKLAETEALLFKFGSGTGSNLSTLRGSEEPLSGGGTSSGPVSFMRGYDSFAGVVKSGGRTRRAAKMVILDADHPDIVEFIECKETEERKAWALIEQGYDGGFNVPGGAYDSVFFQNANHSVRVSDEFMEAVEEDAEWATKARTDGSEMGRYPARELLQKIAQSTWVCGDPGMQFDTVINRWHTCKESGRINSSNPCSEYMFLDDTACNLASLNLLRFETPDGGFDAERFVHVCEVVITAQEILVDRASYPTEKIEANSHLYRPLGLGYANLGALLMRRGQPYDSDEGRATAAAITALLSGSAYRQSGRLAAAKGAFAGFEENRSSMTKVMEMHRDAALDLEASLPDVVNAARLAWQDTVSASEDAGLRNSQISVLAPTGTIAFMMDCDTTGVEPDIGLVKYKMLVGGGTLKIVNHSVETALERLGYDQSAIRSILDHIEENDTIEGAEDLDPEHLAVFDCAFKAARGTRSIHHMGHLKMLASVQPFISGAISKTINLPEHSSVEDIADTYLEAWRLGLKAVAIYRDGCKRSQPLSLDKKDASADAQVLATAAPAEQRRKLPDERQAITHKFSVGGQEGYITVGLYEDGQPGEIFLVMAKEGSAISGLMDVFATSVSIALQSGVPLRTLIRKFSHVRFEPSGFTSNKRIPMAKSTVDYIFRWLGSKFLEPEEQEALGVLPEPEATSGSAPTSQPETPLEPVTTSQPETFVNDQDAPPCSECGTIMIRSGACYHCPSCGATSGCG
ncbi:MAG: vitamin B12-dependent ribonucleotide reductase [Acidobacteriota bacterium]